MNIEMEHLYMKCAHVFEIWKYQSIQSENTMTRIKEKLKMLKCMS